MFQLPFSIFILFYFLLFWSSWCYFCYFSTQQKFMVVWDADFVAPSFAKPTGKSCKLLLDFPGSNNKRFLLMGIFIDFFIWICDVCEFAKNIVEIMGFLMRMSCNPFIGKPKKHHLNSPKNPSKKHNCS